MASKSRKEENYKGILWIDSQMATGFPSIDAQHKEWLSRFNKFEDAIHDKNWKENWTEALLFFIRYTETHFRFEENLMAQYHCSARELNRDEHLKFQARIQEIVYMTWPLGATLNDVLLLEAELVDWLKNHICNIDVKLRDCDKNS
jgi:hemerythrin-like metal-binding protein